MKQISKFYLMSFLKNQTYFAPIFIVMLQFYHLTFQQIFWVFTIGSITSLIVEIPSGIFADEFGKKKSIIISKILIFFSFIIFGFAQSFLIFVVAQIVYELGNAFRSGTETAYIYDYLKQNKNTPSYTLVKGGQKFWARIGEGLASIAGGFIAKFFSFNMVFFIAAIPALLNFFLAISLSRIKENNQINQTFNLFNAKKNLCDLCQKSKLVSLTINITIFTTIIAALSKFIQPYMTEVGLPIEWFGIIYSIFLFLAAFSNKYSYLLENKFGQIRVFNYLSLLAIIPLFILGFGFVSYIGILLFFLIIIIENIRSPIENSIFHDNVDSRKRATLGSELSLSKSLGKIIFLPIIGFVTDTYSMYFSIMIMAIIVLMNGLFFSLNKENKNKI